MSMSLSGGRGYGATGAGQKPKVAGYNVSSLSKYSPEVLQQIQGLLGSAMPGMQGGVDYLSKLAGGGDEEMWNQLEAPALQQFSGLQGNLASRFSGMGTGARKSSGFGLAQSSAASDFAQQLQSNRMGLQRQAIMDLQGIGQDLFGRQERENFLTPKPKPFWQEMLMGLAGGAGQIGSAYGMKKLGF